VSVSLQHTLWGTAWTSPLDGVPVEGDHTVPLFFFFKCLKADAMRASAVGPITPSEKTSFRRPRGGSQCPTPRPTIALPAGLRRPAERPGPSLLTLAACVAPYGRRGQPAGKRRRKL